jgi:hypothetical protein
MKSINSTLWGTAVLVLLMGLIYEVHSLDGLRCHDMLTVFNKDWFWHSGNITIITTTIREMALLMAEIFKYVVTSKI